jgi:Transglycosylase SLT domain
MLLTLPFSRRAAAVLAVLGAMLSFGAASALAAPAEVPCSDIGGGKHQCYFYVPGDGHSGGAAVKSSGGAVVGYLHQGYNWIICQQAGGEVSSGPYHNNTWGWTLSDGNTWGWVNAVDARGGDNDGRYSGTPDCGGAHGAPPGGPPPPPGGGGPAPAQVPCSAIGGGKFSCDWYTAGNGTVSGTPVQTAGGATVGYLHRGSNWIVCQQQGGRVSLGSYHNVWWGWTEADNGSWGWANAVYASGGDNDGAFGGGVPNCSGAHGNPPAGGSGPQPPPPPPAGTCPSTTGAGDNVTRWHPTVVCVLRMLGQPTTPEYVNDVDILIRHESGGNPAAVNRTDINAQRGTPSAGLVQVIPPTFNAHKSSQLPNDILDPAANIYAGLHYGIRRYGSIPNIPGIKSVNNGGRYKPYAGGVASTAGKAKPCGQVRSSGTVLAVNAGHVKCTRARGVARAIERSSAVRRAVKRRAARVRVHTRFGAFRCQVGRAGAGQHAVACASGRRFVSWIAAKV